MSAGLFIVLEGPDGSGKSTLLRPLVERMRAGGVDPVVVREPGGTPAAEMARKAVLDPEHHLSPMAELFFYLAARADLVRTVIRPALAAGPGGAFRPFRPDDRGLPDGGSGPPAGGRCSRPTGPRRTVSCPT